MVDKPVRQCLPYNYYCNTLQLCLINRQVRGSHSIHSCSSLVKRKVHFEEREQENIETNCQTFHLSIVWYDSSYRNGALKNKTRVNMHHRVNFIHGNNSIQILTIEIIENIYDVERICIFAESVCDEVWHEWKRENFRLDINIDTFAYRSTKKSKVQLENKSCNENNSARLSKINHH